MWPKREAELVAGGSLYWVIKGLVLGRQRMLGLERFDNGDGISRCLIRLDPEVVRTLPQPRRAFQGWRYLRPDDAPPRSDGRVRSVRRDAAADHRRARGGGSA